MDLSNPGFWLQLGVTAVMGGAIYGGIRADLRHIGERLTRVEDRLDRDSRIMAYVRKTMPADLESRPPRVSSPRSAR